MVHYLNDREPWRRTGEEYLRKVRREPVHPLIAASLARRTASVGSRNRDMKLPA